MLPEPFVSGSGALFIINCLLVYTLQAQAIMLLAGHGSSVTQDKTVSPAQVQAPIQGPSAYVGNKTHTCSGLPSPIAVTSTSNNELATVKLMGPLASTNNSTEPPKTVGSSSATLIPTGVTLILNILNHY